VLVCENILLLLLFKKTETRIEACLGVVLYFRQEIFMWTDDVDWLLIDFVCSTIATFGFVTLLGPASRSSIRLTVMSWRGVLLVVKKKRRDWTKQAMFIGIDAGSCKATCRQKRCKSCDEILISTSRHLQIWWNIIELGPSNSISKTTLRFEAMMSA
jgi:hypothetical protein